MFASILTYLRNFLNVSERQPPGKSTKNVRILTPKVVRLVFFVRFEVSVDNSR